MNARTPIPRSLTDKETEILTMYTQGHQYKQIATAMGCSVATVQSTKARIYNKLGVLDRDEAVAEAVRRGLIHGNQVSGRGHSTLQPQGTKAPSSA